MDEINVVKNELKWMGEEEGKVKSNWHFENVWIELWQSSWGRLFQALEIVIIHIDPPNK